MIITKLSKRVPYPFIITIVTEKYIPFQSDNCYKSFVLHAYLINIYIFFRKPYSFKTNDIDGPA